MAAVKEMLGRVREPKQRAYMSAATAAALTFVSGALLGILSKQLDEFAPDDAVWRHRLLEALDLGNFFSDMAIWLLAALLLAVFSASAARAASKVFAFFAGMCIAYHMYTVFFSGFDPASYMMIWYGSTLLSPLPAALCWYAKGCGAAAVILDIGIIAVFALACFSIGAFYVYIKGILYLAVFAGALAVLYKSPKQILVSLPAGFLLAFLLSPLWPYR